MDLNVGFDSTRVALNPFPSVIGRSRNRSSTLGGSRFFAQVREERDGMKVARRLVPMKTLARFKGSVLSAFVIALSLRSTTAHAQQAVPAPQAAPPQVIVVQPEQAAPAPQPPVSVPSPAQPAQAPVVQQVQPTFSGPMKMDWDDRRPAPAGYHVESEIRTGLVISGAVTLGTFYALTALGAAISNDLKRGSATALYVPVAGPFVQIGNSTSETGKFFLVLDGLIQTTGAVLLVAGLAAPKTVAVRDDVAKIQIRPVLGPGSAGLVGTF